MVMYVNLLLSSLMNLQGRIQDFRFSGVKETKTACKARRDFGHAHFAAEKWSFPPFSGLYTPYTEYSTRRKY